MMGRLSGVIGACTCTIGSANAEQVIDFVACTCYNAPPVSRLSTVLVVTTVLAGMHPGGAAQASPWTQTGGVVLEGTVVPMTAQSAVLPNGRVFIQNQKIVAVVAQGQAWPAGVNTSGAVVVQTDGYIFPGLINLHNHTAYNTLPVWEAPKKYDNRYQWTGAKTYSTYVNYPKKLLTDSNYFNIVIEVVKYAEVKGLVGGETGVQGSPSRNGIINMLVRNVEAKNFDQDKVYQRGLSIEDSRWQKTVPNFLTKAAAGNVEAWIVHLAEGIDLDPSLAEFTLLKNLDMLHEWTVIIHGTALTSLEFADMATVGSKLVWSPLSNLLLYGETTRVDQAMSAGVPVSLATDWSPSGGKNLLDELKIAYEVNKWSTQNIVGYVPFDEYTLAKMVTINPATALEWDGLVGTIEPGKYADILVISAAPEVEAGTNTPPASPYHALIQATVRDVRLVMVDGEPLYGDVDVMQSTKGTDMEIMCSTAGFVKAIDVTRDGPTKGEQTWASIVDTLNAAMLFDHEHMRQSFKQSIAEAWTIEQFDEWFAAKFKNGVVAMTPDPVYVTDDPIFFDRVKTAGNTPFVLDLETKYYGFLGSGATPIADLGLTEAELLEFVNAATVAALIGDVGVADESAQAIVNHTAMVGPFASKADVITVVGGCAVVVIEAYLAKLKEPPPPPPPVDPPTVPGAEGKLLSMLNHESTTLKVLDDDAALNKKAAQALINYRDGPDGTFGTTDDNLFDSEAEVDSVSYVGPSALSKLYTFSETWTPGGPPVSDQEAKLLAFLNHPTTSLDFLDNDVGLNKNAAIQLIAHRNGPDGVYGNGDDDPFDSEVEVDNVSYVGPTALATLNAWAATWAMPDENQEVLTFVNDPLATYTVFDIDVGLKSLAAAKIVGHRDGPDGEFGTLDDNLFDTIEELDSVPYVGPVTLGQIAAYAPFWSTLSKEPPKLVQFLNHESTTYDVLVTTVGISTKSATNVIAHRNGADGLLGTPDDDPFDSVNEVDEIKYVGSVTLGQLTQYAEGWVAP
jgi:5-methylthioadenosine/S-adenosylhomocysteine deaminase